jgi:nuclear protein localization family protein 4
MVEYEAKAANKMDTETMGDKPAPGAKGTADQLITSAAPKTISGKEMPNAQFGGLGASKLGESSFQSGVAKPGQPTPGAAGGDKKEEADSPRKAFKKEDAKHVSFDLFLRQNGAHQVREQKKSWITDVALPLETSYKPKKVGALVSKMTMDTMPPSINMKRQEYRHVDYVQFMNSPEISNFVNYWLNTFEERVGWLYGYFAEDPDYELGIRAIVEAIYEPPQHGTYNNVEIKQDAFQSQVDIIANGLGLQKIGWMYTSRDHDTFMSPQHIIKAAEYQNENLVKHGLGFQVPKFISVVLKRSN